MKTNLFYKTLVVIATGIFSVIFNIRVVGKDNIPNGGGYIVCANHTHIFDVVFLAMQFKEQLRFMAKAEIFKTKIGSWFFKKLGAFPVVRGSASGSIGAIKTASEILKNGGIFAIFPEGTRSCDGKPKTAKAGVALIASKVGAPVLPVSIYYDGKLKIFKKITIRIGKLIPKETLKMNSKDSTERNRIATLMMDIIKKQWEMGHCL